MLLDIFKKGTAMGIISDIKRKKGFSSEFKNSQFYQGLNNDKKGLKNLIDAEKQVEKLSKQKLGSRFSQYHGDYTITCYFVNFQYFVELLNVHGKEMGLSEGMLDCNNNGWEDLYISLRLSLMGHYKSSFFHLRSFMENYFQMIWEYSIKVGRVDTETKEFKDIKDKVKPKFRYLTSDIKNKNLLTSDINLSYLFDGEEYAKIYDYLSKFTHNKNRIKTDYSETILFDEIIFDKYMRFSGLVMLLTIRVVYAFMKKEMEDQWMKPLQHPIPWEMNYYRYPIGEMIGGNLFHELYEDEINRKLFVEEIGIDIKKLYPHLDDDIKFLKDSVEMKKQAGGDHDKYMDLLGDRFRNN